MVITISKKELMINEQIRDKEVRLVGDDGSQLGIVALSDAKALADEKNLDLVKIAPQAAPPVCKIMDYGKFRFDQSKREKDSRKAQKTVELKEVRLSLNIDTHDFETKAKHAARFLADGHKVKATIRFRGRERAHLNRGIETMEKFADYLWESATVEKPAKMEGRGMFMFLAPIKDKDKAKNVQETEKV